MEYGDQCNFPMKKNDITLFVSISRVGIYMKRRKRGCSQSWTSLSSFIQPTLSLPLQIGAHLPPLPFPTCCVGGTQKMDSWVLVWRGTPCLSQGTVLCSVAGDWEKSPAEGNTHCSCCRMVVCTHVVPTAVDSWAMTKQGLPQVSARTDPPD